MEERFKGPKESRKQHLWDATFLRKDYKLSNLYNYMDTKKDYKIAQRKDIVFCGFDACPNRYAYISRPWVLSKVFNVGY